MTAAACQAVILAAGRGTRMKSAKPKVLHELMGAPLIETALLCAERAGADPIVVVVGEGGDAVRAAVGQRAGCVLQDPPLGTGHAVLSARSCFEEHMSRPLLVLNGDLPLLRPETVAGLLRAHVEAQAAATILTAVLADGGAYGRVRRDAQGRILAIVEAKDADTQVRALREINAGAYVFCVGPLLEALGTLSPKNAQGELYLTDVVAALARADRRVAGVVVEDPSEVLGVNSLRELAELARIVRRRTVDTLLASGVGIEDPETVWVEPGVRVEPDAMLRPYVFLEGRTLIRRGARIGPFVRLVDTEVRENAEVLDHCVLRDCVVGARAAVGPFTHVRPQSHISDRAKVGNFVELKKTYLGEGSKASHLSYLGDATIGPAVNIGAGTITCNYDGDAKHATHIEEGAFIGSDSTLVAPVTVGKNAYVAAGSTITQDVPADALALGRARQVVKPGWAKARRESRPKKA